MHSSILLTILESSSLSIDVVIAMNAICDFFNIIGHLHIADLHHTLISQFLTNI